MQPLLLIMKVVGKLPQEVLWDTLMFILYQNWFSSFVNMKKPWFVCDSWIAYHVFLSSLAPRKCKANYLGPREQFVCYKASPFVHITGRYSSPWLIPGKTKILRSEMGKGPLRPDSSSTASSSHGLSALAHSFCCSRCWVLSGSLQLAKAWQPHSLSQPGVTKWVTL